MATQIQKNVLYNSQVKKNEWVFFYFSAQFHHLSVLMHETNSTGMIWSFLNRDSFPSLRRYDSTDQLSSACKKIYFFTFFKFLFFFFFFLISQKLATHFLQTSVQQTPLRSYEYWIAFYGSPFVEEGASLPFSFEIWYN